MVPNAVRAVHALEIFSFVRMFCPKVTDEELLKDLHETYGPFHINNELVTLDHCRSRNLWIKNPFHARLYDIAAAKIRTVYPNLSDEKLGFTFGQYTLSHSNSSMPELIFIYSLMLFKPFHETIKLSNKYRTLTATTKRVVVIENSPGHFKFKVIHNKGVFVNTILAYSYAGKTDMALRLYNDKSPDLDFHWDRETNDVTVSGHYNPGIRPGLFTKLKKLIFFSRNIRKILLLFIEIYSHESEDQGYDILKIPESFDLSSREKEIIELVLAGKSNREIAETLNISINTVKKHLYNIFNKVGVDSRSQLISLLLF